MLSPRGPVGLEAKFYGLDLVVGLIVVGLGLVLGLVRCGLVLVHLGLMTSIIPSIIRKSMEIMNLRYLVFSVVSKPIRLLVLTYFAIV